jgi:hypothetical protein
MGLLVNTYSSFPTSRFLELGMDLYPSFEPTPGLNAAAAYQIQNLVLQIHTIQGGKFHIDLRT